MNDSRVNEVYDKLYNSKDYFYLANYQYKTIEPDIIRYSSDSFCNDMIEAFATYVPDSATAEEYAHYIISCMTGAAAVDLFFDHLIQTFTKFYIKSPKGFIDEITYNSNLPAKFYQADSCVAGTLFFAISRDPSVVKFEIVFTGLGGTTYSYLDQPITIKMTTDTTKQGNVIHCKVRDLSVDTFKKCLYKLAW